MSMKTSFWSGEIASIDPDHPRPPGPCRISPCASPALFLCHPCERKPNPRPGQHISSNAPGAVRAALNHPDSLEPELLTCPLSQFPWVLLRFGQDGLQHGTEQHGALLLRHIAPVGCYALRGDGDEGNNARRASPGKGSAGRHARCTSAVPGR